MSLSYHFTFSAPATVTVDELLEFLESVEEDAKQMGSGRQRCLRPNLTLPSGCSRWAQHRCVGVEVLAWKFLLSE